MRDALNRRFDVVLAESLDRFSRDQEDTAGLFKRLTFAGVNIVTLAEGDTTTCTSDSRARRTPCS
jgi:DNA invertase Pin-like site-specific DNA recombinase